MAYDLNKIVTKSFERLSWKNTANTTEKPLGDLFPTTALRNYNELGIPSLDLRGVEALLTSADYYGYDVYSVTKEYSTGNIISNGNKSKPLYYESAVDGNTGNDITDLNFWTPKYFFAEQLKNKTVSVIEKTITKTLSSKKELNQTKNVLQNSSLVISDGTRNTTEVKQGRLVGISIRTRDFNNVVVNIPAMGVKLTQSQDLTIYVYHTSQVDPITSFTVPSGQSFKFSDIPDLNLGYITEDYQIGGEFKICYLESDLLGSAIINDCNYNYYANCGCGTTASHKAMKTYKYIRDISGFYVDAADIPANNELWDEDVETIDTNSNYGINFKFNIVCDWTDIILQNLYLWDNALILGMQMGIAELAQGSHRHNDAQMLTKLDAVVQLQSEGGDLRGQYEKACKEIDLDISDMDSPCMPKKAQMYPVTSVI